MRPACAPMERTGLCPIDTREFPDAFLAAYLESERDVFLSGRRDRIAEQVKIDRVPIARIKRIMTSQRARTAPTAFALRRELDGPATVRTAQKTRSQTLAASSRADG